ncbi:hypothetical protein GON01_02535 [Sphingomonas sp. MAH-20]|uniref:Uncharacterized protein n=1 Tax=Sphingomonas horti TaxID=2682842 RepID=A0A6I4IXX4_9SPHN|nr:MULTISPECIES: hypothetical protein [Sphingomonas]MBA2920832.1 hypothetical protein [Sphingomonas sp. CGMCC 1.13658]MVO76818.1 hypothetical protein [Sphingomonas horti]
MDALSTRAMPARAASQVITAMFPDPLDEDEARDVCVTATARKITRVAMVASETASRFQREGIGQDPMAWMLAPRALFGGQNAIEACLERQNFVRAILLHGLSVGLDAAPDQIDRLLADAADDDPESPWMDPGRNVGGNRRERMRRLRLYTAIIVIARGGELVHAFHASFASSAAVIRERIQARLGLAAAEQAQIRLGIDPDCPTTIAMVPPGILDVLCQSGRRPRSSEIPGLDITVEQRLPT